MATKKTTKKRTTKKRTTKKRTSSSAKPELAKHELANVTKEGRRRRPPGMDPVEFRLSELERRVAALED